MANFYTKVFWVKIAKFDIAVAKKRMKKRSFDADELKIEIWA